MRIAAAGALAVVLAATCPARPDDLQSASAAVSARLQSKGGGLAPLYASCPKSNNDEWEYVGSALFVPISQTDSAVLINTGRCDGGNGSGQYLVMSQRGVARVITDARIADMSFLATNAYYFEDTLTLMAIDGCRPTRIAVRPRKPILSSILKPGAES
jgi:hypothetical protein